MIEKIVMHPESAQREVDRVVARAKASPDSMVHWWATLPSGSRDLLAFMMLTALVQEDK